MKPLEFTPQQIWEQKEHLLPEHFDVLRMRVEGHPYVVMALAQAVPRGTIKSRLYRARQRMRELISQTTEQLP